MTEQLRVSDVWSGDLQTLVPKFTTKLIYVERLTLKGLGTSGSGRLFKMACVGARTFSWRQSITIIWGLGMRDTVCFDNMLLSIFLNRLCGCVSGILGSNVSHSFNAVGGAPVTTTAPTVVGVLYSFCNFLGALEDTCLVSLVAFLVGVGTQNDCFEFWLHGVQEDGGPCCGQFPLLRGDFLFRCLVLELTDESDEKSVEAKTSA